MTGVALRVFDSDMHVIEPHDLWQRYIDVGYRDQAPRGARQVPRDIAVEFDGVRYPRNTGLTLKALQESQSGPAAKPYELSETMAYDATSQILAMDLENIDRTVLFPSRGLFVLAFDKMDPKFADAICRAYNDWLFDFCCADRRRLMGAAMVAPHDVKLAVAEARRVVRTYGFKAIFLRPNPINGRYWHDSYFDPLWAELSSLDIPVVFHEGGSGELPGIEQTGARFNCTSMAHVVTHPLEMMQACISICMGGVLERFPNLRVAFLEANCSWVEWLLWRMDEHMDWRGHIELPALRLRPSEYFRSGCFVSIDCDELPALRTVEYLDGEQIVFSCDYPHGDSKFPNATRQFIDLPICNEHKKKILWDNTAKLYRV